MQIPFVDLKAQYKNMQAEMDAAIASVLNETAFIGGKYVKAFEEQFAALYNVKHVVSCANGTDSLYIIMKMLGIGEGDEVITAANSWISSSETISQTGAKAVFADVHPEYYSMDETRLEALITPATKAMLVVHLQGQMCDIETINKICQKHNIHLIEDCAQSHFSEYKGKRAGLTGIAGSFSFYPGKNLGAYGDAGCIITNDDQLAEKCRMYANHGALNKHHHHMEGINSRLDGLQAAILSAKLPYILTWTQKRIDVAAWYNRHLQGITQIKLPAVRPESKHTYHLYVIRAQKRDELMQYLKEQGIETAIHYPTPLPGLPAYKYLNYNASDYPVAAQLQPEILSLPIYPEMTEDMVAHVSQSLRTFYAKG
jgi:dTDP-4-amino-4,6-dideoxygalactose transaminase